jgi:hypothetical protein
MTHTYAVLEVEPETFDEIRGKLETAGYAHAFEDGGQTIDMHGIALRATPVRWYVTALLLAMLALACVGIGTLIAELVGLLR